MSSLIKTSGFPGAFFGISKNLHSLQAAWQVDAARTRIPNLNSYGCLGWDVEIDAAAAAIEAHRQIAV